MKPTKFHALVVLLFIAVNVLNAQKFLEPSFSYSDKKPSFLTLENGKELEGYIRKIKHEKGLFSEMTIEDQNGEKTRLQPEEIKFMYLPQSGFDKFLQGVDQATDVQKWNNEGIDQQKIKEGYIYFEQAEVMVKNKKMTLLMQLLNPSFSNKVKVYHDPYAKETTSVGFGGFTMAGGDAKSYYVSANGKPAFKLEKKNYDDEFSKLYGKCKAIQKKFDKVKWPDFEEHVYVHSTECE
jgi:hypothetical protein